MNQLDRLIQHFEKFPGVGARQAKRFAFHILTMDNEGSSELAKLIEDLRGTVVECQDCHRFFTTTNHAARCNLCTSSNRDQTKLLIVERDADIEAIERAGVYDGLYFVFGGTVPLLNTKENNKLRGGALKRHLESGLAGDLKEIILGFSVSPDGENTARFVTSIITNVDTEQQLILSYLGRGLSTGSELEYADTETLKHALQHRVNENR